MKPVRIAILASGRGSNFDAIAEAVTQKRLNAEIVALLSDQPKTGALEKAAKRGIPTLVVPAEKDRKAHDRKVIEALRSFNPRFLVLAGYMRIVTGELIEAFRSDRGYSRIVNIHPSLLPSFPGLHGYSQAFHHGAKLTGVTVHLVEQDVDSGPICAQESFSIADCRSAEEVEQRGLPIEHRLYPAALEWILREKFEIQERSKLERRLCVCPN